ncbi:MULTISPECIES: hypothetical protein [unclassified Nocardiopsis]|jgi:ABC-type transport system involved in cytochrome c biogenesis permease subunit|uniref:hypothetical protein n=1 Tax=unclassified Nocardiopsis TaxID=2649073 RepID=UPI00066C4B24|nr:MULTISPECIES: hypothetical protein [unclassified Nocardiopsis]MBQ1082083.1 hypothetical protein [Nocardiopsis sp. B62]
MRTSATLSVLVLVWLAIGVAAAAQRGDFSASEASCSSVGSVVVTIFVGPLNYVGVNPTVECPDLPEPSE